MTAVRRSQLIRFGVWVGLATVAVLAAVLAARTETGVRRIAGLLSSEPAAAARSAKDASLANRAFDQEAEQRRLSEAVRMLAADRDRLLARVNTLERSLEDVTGSVGGAAPRAAASGTPSAVAAPPAPAPVASTPAPPPGPPTAAMPSTPAQGQTRVASGYLANSNPMAAESVATKTEFGVDLGSNTSVEGLKAQWAALKSGQPGLLEGLRPVVTIREAQKGGGVELRLVAGPLVNASVAARLCAAFAAAGQICQPTVFDGQKLALQ
jgi:hypothetical protein